MKYHEALMCSCVFSLVNMSVQIANFIMLFVLLNDDAPFVDNLVRQLHLAKYYYDGASHIAFKQSLCN